MFKAAVIKDIQLLLRDRGALLSLFILPLIFVSVFGNLVATDIEGAGEARTLAFYSADEDRALRSKEVLSVSGLFRIKEFGGAAAVRSWVANDESRVGIIFPEGYDPKSGIVAELVLDEATPLRFRGPIEGAISGLLLRAAGSQQPPRVMQVKSPPGAKARLDEIDGFQVSVPGNAVLFGFFMALTMAISFVEDRKSGTWRRLLAAPVRRPVILVAKLVPYFLVGLVQMAFLFGVGALAFGMRVAGSIPALVVLTVAVVFAAVALGLMIASFGGSQKQVGSVGSIALLVMGLLGGAMIPRLSMPDTMQVVGLGTPHAWALDGYYDLLMRDGAGFADVGVEIAAVFGFGIAFAVMGAMRFRFER